jgi:hypothetical protein
MYASSALLLRANLARTRAHCPRPTKARAKQARRSAWPGPSCSAALLLPSTHLRLQPPPPPRKIVRPTTPVEQEPQEEEVVGMRERIEEGSVYRKTHRSRVNACQACLRHAAHCGTYILLSNATAFKVSLCLFVSLSFTSVTDRLTVIDGVGFRFRVLRILVIFSFLACERVVIRLVLVQRAWQLRV